MSLSKRSRSRSATSALATSRMPPSFSTRCWSLSTDFSISSGAGRLKRFAAYLRSFAPPRRVGETVRRVLDDYRHLFESNPNPMLIYEIGTLLLLAVNDALLHGLGYTRDELVGRSILVLHPPDEHQRVRDLLERVRSGQVLGFHRAANMRHLRKDGSLVEIEAAGQPTEFEGKAARLVLLSDVGERRRTERVTARYAALFDRARDIILFIASDGRTSTPTRRRCAHTGTRKRSC